MCGEREEGEKTECVISLKIGGSEDGGLFELYVQGKDLKEAEECFLRIYKEVESRLNGKKGEMGNEVI